MIRLRSISVHTHIPRWVVAASVLVAVVLLACMATRATASDTPDPTEQPKPVTLVGEVLDLYCYMKNHGVGQGPEHADCAKRCIRQGLPIGFLADGKVYVLLGKDRGSAKNLVVDYAGVTTKLTGLVFQYEGMSAIEMVSIESVAPQSGK